ncbi:MAG: tail fiber domain-containing protein [Ignavibacteriae bacterium]|nr:tail fiber domain-containing protein [Ignavibacteriota bacterium]
MKHVLFTLSFAMLLFVSVSISQVPRYITHQGLLTDASGAPFDTTISMTFRLYTVLTGGTSQYSQVINNVAVASGVFNVTIGPLSLAFDKQYYLEVEAGSDVLSPRNQLTSAAYSLGPWTTNGNDLYYSFGNVAIGTTTPGSKLDIRGNVRIGDGSTAEQDILFSSANGNWEVGTNNSGNGTSSNQFYIFDGSNSSYIITAQKGTGNVGIGTNSPSSKLTVNGSLSSTSLSTGAITASSLSVSSFSPSTMSATSWMLSPTYYVSNSSTALIRTGNTGTYQGAANFNFGAGGMIMEQGVSEGSGIYCDGDYMAIWTPGDAGLLKVYDEDGMVLRWQLDGSGNASTVSDARLKENVSQLSGALDKVSKLRGVDYNYKHNTEEQTKIAAGKMKVSKSKSLGFIAQEREQIVPEAITTDETTGYKSVAYDMIIPLLVEAIKEQQKEIKELRALMEKK